MGVWGHGGAHRYPSGEAHSWGGPQAHAWGYGEAPTNTTPQMGWPSSPHVYPHMWRPPDGEMGRLRFWLGRAGVVMWQASSHNGFMNDLFILAQTVTSRMAALQTLLNSTPVLGGSQFVRAHLRPETFERAAKLAEFLEQGKTIHAREIVSEIMSGVLRVDAEFLHPCLSNELFPLESAVYGLSAGLNKTDVCSQDLAD